MDSVYSLQDFLTRLCSEFGPVERVKVLKSFAFIHFAERAHAEAALAALNENGVNIMGQRVKFQWSKPPPRQLAGSYESAGSGAFSLLQPFMRPDMYGPMNHAPEVAPFLRRGRFDHSFGGGVADGVRGGGGWHASRRMSGGRRDGGFCLPHQMHPDAEQERSYRQFSRAGMPYGGVSRDNALRPVMGAPFGYPYLGQYYGVGGMPPHAQHHAGGMHQGSPDSQRHNGGHFDPAQMGRDAYPAGLEFAGAPHPHPGGPYPGRYGLSEPGALPPYALMQGGMLDPQKHHLTATGPSVPIEHAQPPFHAMSPWAYMQLQQQTAVAALAAGMGNASEGQAPQGGGGGGSDSLEHPAAAAQRYAELAMSQAHYAAYLQHPEAMMRGYSMQPPAAPPGSQVNQSPRTSHLKAQEQGAVDSLRVSGETEHARAPDGPVEASAPLESVPAPHPSWNALPLKSELPLKARPSSFSDASRAPGAGRRPIFSSARLVQPAAAHLNGAPEMVQSMSALTLAEGRGSDVGSGASPAARVPEQSGEAPDRPFAPPATRVRSSTVVVART